VNGPYQFPNVIGVPPVSPYTQQPQFGQMYGVAPQYADGGMVNPTPQFQNPFGPQQAFNDPRMNNPGPMQQYAFDPRMQPQSMSVGNNPQQPGLPSLLSNNTQNQYPNGYTPIGQPQQNLTNYGMYRS
jgi:hypothetical protein